MGYNVTKWKTKELDSLRIPINAMYDDAPRGWEPNLCESPDGKIRLEFTSSRIDGTLCEPGVLLVSEIYFCDDGSGIELNQIVVPALRKLTGKLVAVRVWEGGDSIDEITVNDGEIRLRQIEL